MRLIFTPENELFCQMAEINGQWLKVYIINPMFKAWVKKYYKKTNQLPKIPGLKITIQK